MIQVEVIFLGSDGRPMGSGLRNFARVPVAGEFISGMGITGVRCIVTEVDWKFDGRAVLTACEQ